MDPAASEAQQQAGQSAEAMQQAESRPEWLPDNFKSPEEMRRSYDEQFATITRLHEERARQDELLNEMVLRMEEAPQGQPQMQPQNDPLVARLEQALEEGDAMAVLAISSFIADQRVEQAFAEQAKGQGNQPDAQAHLFAAAMMAQAQQKWAGESDVPWSEIEQDVAEQIRQKPGALRQTFDPAVAAEDLLDLARLAAIKKGTPPQRANAPGQGIEGALAEAGVAGDRAKMLAQTLAGAGARVVGDTDDDAAYRERIKAATPLEWRG